MLHCEQDDAEHLLWLTIPTDFILQRIFYIASFSPFLSDVHNRLCDIWYLQKREEDRQQCKKYLWNICQKTWENQIGSRIEIWQLWDWLFFQSLLRFVFSATRHWCRQKKKRRKKERDLKISFEEKNSQGKKKTDSRTYSNIIWEMFNLWSTTTTRRNKISFFFSRLFF